MLCCVCSTPIQPSLILDNMPAAAQSFAAERSASITHSVAMAICQCAGCGTVQHTGASVPYFRNAIRSGKISAAMLAFRQAQFSRFIANFGNPITSIFELGAGEGEHLDIFKDKGCRTGGIEGDFALSKLSQSKGHAVINGFLGSDAVPAGLEAASYDAVVSFNLIEHLPSPRDSLRALSGLLVEGGSALLEVPNFDMIDANSLFNEFIPDHRCYFTADGFRTLLSLSGFEVISIEPIWDDYILSAQACRRTSCDWSRYERQRELLCSDIIDFFDGTPSDENAIWSAGHQSLATISNLNIAGKVSCVIDSAPAKQGKFTPASSLPIVAPAVLEAGNIRKILLAAAGFNDEIIKTIRAHYSPDIKIAILEKGRVENV